MEPLRVPLALMLLYAGVALAQSSATPPPKAASTVSGTEASRGAAPSAPPAVYVSPLSGYRTFADEPVVSWREANETVRRIGGWREYGREAQRDLRSVPNSGSAPAAPTGDARPGVRP